MHRNLLLMFILLSRTISTKIPLIRNLNHPACINCVHFITDHPNNHVFAKCKLFGQMDIVTGSISYDYAKMCRENESKCGLNGSKYEEKGKNDTPSLGTSSTCDL